MAVAAAAAASSAGPGPAGGLGGPMPVTASQKYVGHLAGELAKVSQGGWAGEGGGTLGG